MSFGRRPCHFLSKTTCWLNKSNLQSNLARSLNNYVDTCGHVWVCGTHAEQAEVKVQQRHEHEDEEHATSELQEVLRRALMSERRNSGEHATRLPPALRQKEEEAPAQRQVPAEEDERTKNSRSCLCSSNLQLSCKRAERAVSVGDVDKVISERRDDSPHEELEVPQDAVSHHLQVTQSHMISTHR